MLPEKSQRGYIAETVIIFMLFASAFLFPWNFKKAGQGVTCPTIGNAPNYGKQLIVQFPENRGNRQTMVDYVLVRENVIMGGAELVLNTEGHASQWPNHPAENITKPDSSSKIYRPLFADDWGELSAGFEFQPPYYNTDAFYGGDRLYNFNKEGYMYAMHLNDSGSPIVLDLDGDGDTGEPPFAHVADLYQEKSIYDDSSRPYDDKGKIFECPKNGMFLDPNYRYGSGENRGLTVVVPSQATSLNRDQLQMEWFLLNNNSLLRVHCKPAIYLYPKTTQLVNVKVNTKGILTYVDPPYPEQGWNVTAYPEGTIEVTSNKAQVTSYPYLYYESKIPDELIHKPTKGWVVKYAQLNDLYKNILPKLGLNDQQTRDFIVYWNKALKDDAPYYFVGIMDQSNIDQFEGLEITPKPDSINRVRIYFEKLDQPKDVEAPALSVNDKRSTNNEFRVVEWGGMVKNDPNHPFTCSQ